MQAGYEAFVKREAGWYIPMIDTARSLTMFMPGRFGDSELHAEVVYAGMNLLSLYHEHITDSPKSHTCALECKGGKDTRLINRLRRVLTFFYYTQVAMELAAKRSFGRRRGGTRRKWLVIAAIEAMKLYCKLRLMQQINGRMLVRASPEELERQAIKQKTLASFGLKPTADGDVNDNEDSGSNGSVAAKCDGGESDDSGAGGKVQLQPKFRPYSDLVRLYAEHGRSAVEPHGRFVRAPDHPRDSKEFKPPASEVVAEVLFHSRPLVYVIGQLLCKRRSWAPWVAAVFTDAASRYSLPDSRSLSPRESGEMQARMQGYLYYLLQSPMFESFTKVPLRWVARMLGKLPLLGGLVGGLMEVLFALQVHYFYVSNS